MDTMTDASLKRPLDGDGGEPPSTRQRTDGPEGSEQGHIKVLLPDTVVGTLLGKGGSNFTEHQKNHNVQMKLSQKGIYFPGSYERVLLIQGQDESLLSCLRFIQETIEGAKLHDSADRDRNRQMKLVLTDNAAGSVIGKGGEKVRSLSTQSGARISISQKEPERVVTITGEKDNIMRAAAEILPISRDEPNTSVQYPPMHHSYGGPPGRDFGGPGRGPPPGYGRDPYAGRGDYGRDPYGGRDYGRDMYGGGGHMATGEHSVEMQIPDEMVGCIIGKAGSALNDIMRQSGSRIRLSQKGEYIPGTHNRKITFTGTQQANEYAQFLIQERMTIAQQERQRAPADAQAPPTLGANIGSRSMGGYF